MRALCEGHQRSVYSHRSHLASKTLLVSSVLLLEYAGSLRDVQHQEKQQTRAQLATLETTETPSVGLVSEMETAQAGITMNDKPNLSCIDCSDYEYDPNNPPDHYVDTDPLFITDEMAQQYERETGHKYPQSMLDTRDAILSSPNVVPMRSQ